MKQADASHDRMKFLLGGQDLEMVTIRDLVRETLGEDAVIDARLPWGARASAYAHAIGQIEASGGIPVLVELEPDMPLPAATISIDHHGSRAGEPCSLRQVFELLGLPDARWSRHYALVAANDVGHIEAMRRMGASVDEIASIRAADRAAQGISPQEEEAGLFALQSSVIGPGGVRIVRLPHARTATVTDPLALLGETADLLIHSPDSTHFFGDGRRIAQLDAAYPGGWRGGELPRRGFWGVGRNVAEDELRKLFADARES